MFPLNSQDPASQPAIDRLRQQLDDYYRKPLDYVAFTQPYRQVRRWNLLLEGIRARLKESREVRILEVGAGRSEFAQFLRENVDQEALARITYHAQDVTPHNAEWLNEQANRVWIGDIQTIEENNYDLIFSMFVFEHVTDPAPHLQTLKRLIRPSEGAIWIFCPRYDVPFYTNPCIRHLSPVKRGKIALRVFGQRLSTWWKGEPRFLIQPDPAILTTPFFTDADAVHWASLGDLRAWARQNEMKVTVFPCVSAPLFSKFGLVQRWGTINARLTQL